jgi:hypothetical protein
MFGGDQRAGQTDSSATACKVINFFRQVANFILEQHSYNYALHKVPKTTRSLGTGHNQTQHRCTARRRTTANASQTLGARAEGPHRA